VGQYEQPLDTCSEMNYNMNYGDDNGYNDDSYEYINPWQNGSISNFGPYDHQTSSKKALPQPPMSYSQSVNDGFSHRGASLPATPISQQRFSRQLPKHTSPTHQSQFRGLPKLTRQLPPSTGVIESAASTFSSLFGMGKSSKKSALPKSEYESKEKSIFSLLSESKPQVSQLASYMDTSTYNENYNYAYNSYDSTDDQIMVIEKHDDQSSFAINRTLPSVPANEMTASLDYDSYR
jgi:hypothetical protein